MRNLTIAQRITIIAAFIGAIGVIAAAIIGILPKIRCSGGKCEWVDTPVTIHITNENDDPIGNAKIILVTEKGIENLASSEDGQVSLADKKLSEGDRLIIETAGYELYDQELSEANVGSFDIKLEELSKEKSTVVIRIIDEQGKPISQGDVSLLIDSRHYRQTTDTNGIAEFQIFFTENKLEALMAVSAKNFEIKDQKVTLVPNKFQTVQLSRLPNPTMTPQPTSDRDTSGLINFGETIKGNITEPAVTNVYKFNAEAGSRVVVSMTVTSGELKPKMRLYAPDGSEVDDAWASMVIHAEINEILPESGEYKILVEDFTGNNTGEYNLNIQRL